jgi:hypothetical protein
MFVPNVCAKRKSESGQLSVSPQGKLARSLKSTKLTLTWKGGIQMKVKLLVASVLLLFAFVLSAVLTTTTTTARACSGDDCGCGVYYQWCSLNCVTAECRQQCRRDAVKCAINCCGAGYEPPEDW